MACLSSLCFIFPCHLHCLGLRTRIEPICYTKFVNNKSLSSSRDRYAATLSSYILSFHKSLPLLLLFIFLGRSVREPHLCSSCKSLSSSLVLLLSCRQERQSGELAMLTPSPLMINLPCSSTSLLNRTLSLRPETTGSKPKRHQETAS